MQYNISKELLSKVLGIRVDSFYSHVSSGMLGYFCNNDQFQEEINIYELAHKCKEWATSQGFIILTYGEAYYNVDVHYHSNKSKFGNLAFSADAKTEPEAIFKACKWILDNKDTQ